MNKIEILVEEPSMKVFLTILLPKIIKHPWQLNQNYFIRSFEGKNDLIKNIPPKIKAFSKQNNVGIVILPEFQKVSGATKIAPFINIQSNSSVSFNQTMSGLKNFFEKNSSI